MLIDTSGFHLAGAAGPPPPKRFLLEGTTDLFTAMPATERFSESGEGPVYPSLGRVVFRGLEALERTVEQLGKHPTPDEMDRSNIRRLARAMAPVVEAHRDCYQDKGYRKATAELSALTKAVGRYKDVGILEREVEGLCPGGRVPGRIARRLEKKREKEAERFRDAYKHFRKHGLETVVEVLGSPSRLESGSPSRIEAEDRRALGRQVLETVDRAEATGVVHEDPEEFHEGRKDLRRMLNALGAAEGLFAVDAADVQAVKALVDGLGVAQDSYIAWEWLDGEGFREEARAARAAYDARHATELEAARAFEEAGVLERIREAVKPCTSWTPCRRW